MKHEALSKASIGYAMHHALGPGLPGSGYQNAPAHDVRKQELGMVCEQRLQVPVDEFAAAMFVEELIRAGNNAVQAIQCQCGVQRVNSLAASGVGSGLPLNFGADRLQFKRKHRTHRPKAENGNDPEA